MVDWNDFDYEDPALEREPDEYAMILKYQLYPWTHLELARRVARELSLPVDAPKALAEGTMNRFENWHRKNL